MVDTTEDVWDDVAEDILEAVVLQRDVWSNF